MDEELNGGAPAWKRYLPWLIGGGVVLLALLLGSRGGRAQVAAVRDQSANTDPLRDLMLQEQVDQLRRQKALRGLEEQRSILEFEAFRSESRYRQVTADRLTDKASKVQVRCPKGKTKLDPQTGQLYCREDQSGGFFGDVLNPQRIIQNINDIARIYFGGGGATPPIVRPN